MSLWCMATTPRSQPRRPEEGANEDVRKRDVGETEILGRCSRWREEGLAYEASDKHRQALGGLRLFEESRTVNSAEVKAEDANMLDEAERKFRSLAATLNNMSLDRSDVPYVAQVICTRMANPTQGSRD